MNVAVLIDRGIASRRDPQMRTAWNFSEEAQVDRSVVQALRGNRHDVTVVSFEGDVLAALHRLRPDVVFNLTEWLHGDRRRAGDIPTLLEALGLRYTGAGQIGQVLSADKAVSKLIVRELGITVPDFEVLPAGRTSLTRAFTFPVLIKPRYGEGSEGITLRSLARTPADVARIARRVHEQFGQAAICEEFIDGRELSVGLLGNHPLTVLPARETVYGRWRPNRPRFNTLRVKSSPAFRAKFRIATERARLPATAAERLSADCKRIFRALELRDYGRIDWRQAADGRIVFIEANSNCELKPSSFGLMAAWAGITYAEVIERIVQQARRRRCDRVRHRHARPLF